MLKEGGIGAKECEPYEGRTHLPQRGRKKPYGPTTKAYGLACYNFKQICFFGSIPKK